METTKDANHRKGKTGRRSGVLARSVAGSHAKGANTAKRGLDSTFRVRDVGRQASSGETEQLGDLVKLPA